MGAGRSGNEVLHQHAGGPAQAKSQVVLRKGVKPVWEVKSGEPEHIQIVRQALSEGKYVPPEVLKEYPELEAPNAQKTGTQTQGPSKEAGTPQGPGPSLPLRNAAENRVEATAGEVNPPTPPTTPPPPTEPPPAPASPTPPEDPVVRLRAALRNAKGVRTQQEQMYSKERAKRFSAAEEEFLRSGRGEGAFYSSLGKLKGELEKVEFESIRNQFTQQDMDSLFKTIGESSKLPSWGDKTTAMRGLAKLFGEMGGRVPQAGELSKLKRVFGQELVDDLIQKQSLLKRGMDLGLEIANVPRAIMSSLDLSAPFRQGVFMVSRPEFWKAWEPMLKSAWNEQDYNFYQQMMERDPDFELMRDTGLTLTDLEQNIYGREEKFATSLAEKIPGLGRIIRGSGRAYTAFLNKLRFDSWKSMVNDAEALGLKPRENSRMLRDLGTFINSATGRGPLPGALEGAAPALNATFFSPRLMASRIDLITKAFRPDTYMKLDPFVRQQYFKHLFKFLGLGSTALGLLALNGWEVGTDWRSSDFGKAKKRNTRLDVWGGFQQYMRMAGQLISGEYKSSITGKIVTLGEGYKPLTRWDIFMRQLEAKEAPVASFISALLKQQTFTGEPVSVPKELGKRLIPMMSADIYQVLKDDPSMLPATALGVVGFGSQTYGAEGLPGKISSYREKILSEKGREPTETEKFDFYNQLRSSPEDSKLVEDITPRKFRQYFTNYTIGRTGKVGELVSSLTTGTKDFKVQKLLDYSNDLSETEMANLIQEARKAKAVSPQVINMYLNAKAKNP